jgi:hypothetical protein
VSADDGLTHGFLRNRHGEFTKIDFPKANFTVAAGINSRGDIVGPYNDAGGKGHGFAEPRRT